MERKYVVVRTSSAGVHVGELSDRRGGEVDLVCARRIWSWAGANTLHEIANNGVGVGSRISEVVDEITLLGVIEVITCRAEARQNLEAAKWQ